MQELDNFLAHTLPVIIQTASLFSGATAPAQTHLQIWIRFQECENFPERYRLGRFRQFIAAVESLHGTQQAVAPEFAQYFAKVDRRDLFPFCDFLQPTNPPLGKPRHVNQRSDSISCGF
jgi:hypothetical protein